MVSSPSDPAMSQSNPIDLYRLKIRLDGLAYEEKERVAKEWYDSSYLWPDRLYGVHSLHDKQKVIFHASTFYHAFYKLSTNKKSTNRNVLDEIRVERMRWIMEVISGRVDNAACFEQVADLSATRPQILKRFYIVYSPGYIVWLEPRTPRSFEETAWKFSSAFPSRPEYLRDRARGAKLLHTWPALR